MLESATYQRGIHAPHLCGPYRQPQPQPAKDSSSADDAELRVYCDLDGVLADFNRGCLDLFPEGGPIAEKIPTHTVTKLTHDEEIEMWRRVESKADFFAALDWMPDGEELWRWIDWNIVPPPAVLTGLPLGRVGQMASKQKEQWCKQKLGNHVMVFCCGTRNKQKFSGRNCVLIDDRGDLREAWEARGGIFIHHTSAADSLRQLKEVLHGYHRSRAQKNPGVGERPLHLTSICWAAQTPAGCFRPNCRYQHVPISHRHRCWIQMWGFVWWNQRMFDDLDGLTDCVRAVYAPKHEAAFLPQHDDDMDEQSQGAFRRMCETLRDVCELGLPFGFLPTAVPSTGLGRPQCQLSPLSLRANNVLEHLRKIVQPQLTSHGKSLHLVIVGSMGLGIDIDTADVDIVLCSPVELDPLDVLHELQSTLENDAESHDLQMIDQAVVPVLNFRMFNTDVDVVANQMSSIRDTILFRYALQSSGPDLAGMLRLLKDWIRSQRIPLMKQGGYPTLVWMRMAVRFYQEQYAGTDQPFVGDWLRQFFVWASKGLPTGGAPLTIHGEQAESSSSTLAAGVPPATLLLFLSGIYYFLEMVRAVRQEPQFEARDPHTHLCSVGSWRGCRAFFYIRAGEGSPSEVALCRVLGVFGGPPSEMRRCCCTQCSQLNDSDPTKRHPYVSRRSKGWLMMVSREDTQRLRVQTALHDAGIQKRSFAGKPVQEHIEEKIFLLHPYHLVCRIDDDMDPIQTLVRMQQTALGHPWLPDAAVVGARIELNVFLSAKRFVEPDAQLQDSRRSGTVCWCTMHVDRVYERDPLRRAAEEARAKNAAVARLFVAARKRPVHVLQKIVEQEKDYAGDTPEYEEALATLRNLSRTPHSQEKLCNSSQEAPHSSNPSSTEASDSDAEHVGASESAASTDVGLLNHSQIVSPAGGDGRDDTAARTPDANNTGQRAPAKKENFNSSLFPHEDHPHENQRTRVLNSELPKSATVLNLVSAKRSDDEVSHVLSRAANGDVVELVLEKTDATDIFGFSCEARAATQELLRIVSISEHGILARHNRSASTERKVSEGSWIIAANGKKGFAEHMRKELDNDRIALTIVLEQSRKLMDESGRKIVGKTGSLQSSVKCRCGDFCKCGLSDALGLRDRTQTQRNPWPALCIDNLHPRVEEKQLYDFFTAVGPVATVRVVRNTTTWHSECHGYVNFNTFHDAEQALQKLDRTTLLGRTCNLSWSTRSGRAGSDMMLNLDQEAFHAERGARRAGFAKSGMRNEADVGLSEPDHASLARSIAGQERCDWSNYCPSWSTRGWHDWNSWSSWQHDNANEWTSQRDEHTVRHDSQVAWPPPPILHPRRHGKMF